jgi:hypothetical protein
MTGLVDRTPDSGAGATPATRESGAETEPMLYCPVCSLRLGERKCKLYCARCGYFMSCSDYC